MDLIEEDDVTGSVLENGVLDEAGALEDNWEESFKGYESKYYLLEHETQRILDDRPFFVDAVENGDSYTLTIRFLLTIEKELEMIQLDEEESAGEDENQVFSSDDSAVESGDSGEQPEEQEESDDNSSGEDNTQEE